MKTIPDTAMTVMRAVAAGSIAGPNVTQAQLDKLDELTHDDLIGALDRLIGDAINIDIPTTRFSSAERAVLMSFGGFRRRHDELIVSLVGIGIPDHEVTEAIEILRRRTMIMGQGHLQITTTGEDWREADSRAGVVGTDPEPVQAATAWHRVLIHVADANETSVEQIIVDAMER